LCFIDEWLMFDDENVSMVTSEDILRLSGGGHTFIHWLQTFVILTYNVSAWSSVITANLVHLGLQITDQKSEAVIYQQDMYSWTLFLSKLSKFCWPTAVEYLTCW